MNLQAEKLEVVRLVLDAKDKEILHEVKALFKTRSKELKTEADLTTFYEGFRDGVREVRAAMDGKIQLKDAKTWLNEIPD